MLQYLSSLLLVTIVIINFLRLREQLALYEAAFQRCKEELVNEQLRS